VRAARQLLRLGEYLVGRACRRLPPEVRAERYREWTAELPAILGDPVVRPGWRRLVRMLRYALGTRAGAAALTPGTRRRRLNKHLISTNAALILASCAYEIWQAVKGPPDWVHYALAGYFLALILVLAAVFWWRSHRRGQPRRPDR
jgi:hypothetical protein